MEDLLGPYAYYKLITDPDDRPVDCEFKEVNGAFERMSGLKKDELKGKRFSEIFPKIYANVLPEAFPEGFQETEPVFSEGTGPEFSSGPDTSGADLLEIFGKAALRGEPGVFEYHDRASEKWYLIQVHSSKKKFLSAYYTDITALKQREAVLARNNRLLVKACEQTVESEKHLKKQLEENRNSLEEIRNNQDLNQNRYRSMVEESGDLIYCCALNGVITFVNKSFCKAAGKPAEELIGENIGRFLRFENTEITWNHFLLKGVITAAKQAEHEIKLPDGSVRHYQITLVPIFDIHKKIIEVIGTNHDITAIKHNEQKMMDLAYRDPLTDLPNKNLFLDRLNTSIATHRRTGAKAGVILVDLDDFKRYKNNLGHAAADRIILEAAQKLVSCMRDHDTVARIGEDDDKFLLLFQNIRNNDELFSIVQRIKSGLDEPYVIGDAQVKISASMGIAVFPEDGADMEAILINVDKAMYMAKELGKDRCHFFNERLKEELGRKTKLEAMLINALANQEFELYYQPQYEALARKLRGFEALIRWNNPVVGLVMPAEFIPSAEETGVIVPIGTWAIRTACRLCSKLNKTHGLNLSISVNISPVQLKQEDFCENVVKAVRESGLKMSNLELEITESAFSDQDDVNSVLRVLKDQGVRITLTDFGTGSFSIGDLKRLPVNMVKLDKEFIHEIDQSSYQDALAESIISLMHKLDIELMAVGVENIKQYDYLIKGECDNIQGFFFEEPVPENMIDDVVKKGVLEDGVLRRVVQRAGLTYEGLVKRETTRVGKTWDSKF